MKTRIEIPMYVTEGFAKGLEKDFPEAASNYGEIINVRNQATQFLKDTGNMIRKVEEVRKANVADPTQTEQAKAVNTWDYATKKAEEIEKRFEKLPDINSTISKITDDIEATLKQGADSSFGREARARIASMPEAERSKFLAEVVQKGDLQTARYVLGAPSFFSGIPDAIHSKIKDQYKSTVFPEEMQAVKALQSLKTHLDKGYKATQQTFRDIHAHASKNGALDKSEKAQKLMNE